MNVERNRTADLCMVGSRIKSRNAIITGVIITVMLEDEAGLRVHDVEVSLSYLSYERYESVSLIVAVNPVQTETLSRP